MARPVVSQITESMYDGLKPLAHLDEDLGWPLLNLCEAYLGSLQPVEDLIRDTDDGPGWSSIMDVNRAPYVGLPWLGQLVGLTTPDRKTGETLTDHETRIRAYVEDVPGFGRGTRQAIIGAAKQFLIGEKDVVIRERWGGAYKLQVRTYTAQTLNVDAVRNAILSQKPGGIVLDYATVAGQDYQSLYDNNLDYGEVYTKYATYQGVLEDTPGE